jgi:hypothetical protein
MTMQTSYLAYHCLYCKDTGRDDGHSDPTLADNVHRCTRACFVCQGAGAILIGAQFPQGSHPYQGERWPERDRPADT